MVEGLVGMVQQHVAPQQHLPRHGVRQRRGRQRAPGRIAQILATAVGQCLQAGKVERRDGVHVLFGHSQAGAEKCAHGGGRRIDFQPHDTAGAALYQHRGHRLDEVLVGGFVDLQVGVAGNPKQGVVGHPIAGEQLTGMQDDRLLDEQKALLAASSGNGTQAVEAAGNGHQRHRRLILLGGLGGRRIARRVRACGCFLLQADGEVQAQTGHGRRTAGQPGRGERGKDPVAEIIGGGSALLRAERGGRDDADAGSMKLRHDLGVQRPVLQFDHRVRRGRQPREALPSSGRGGQTALERRHPHHEELVEVGADDGQEAQPFQQRHLRAQCLIEHAPVELHPAQLPVQEGAVTGHRRSHRTIPRAHLPVRPRTRALFLDVSCCAI